MPTREKEQAVEAMKDWMEKCTVAIATNYAGLPVATMTNLRRALRESGVQYKIIKNTLAYLAADAAGKPGLKEIVKGPTAIAFTYGEQVDPAKALSEFMRTNRSSLSIIGGFLDDKVLSAADVENLASLPSKDELLARLLGQMQAPTAGLVRVLNGPIEGLARVLQAQADKISAE